VTGFEGLQLGPVVLVPVLVWIAYRYLPLLEDCGRAQVYLLMFLVGGTVAVQIGVVHRGAYPLATWTMYTETAVDARTWRFVVVEEEGERRFAWQKAAPVRSIRAFERNFRNLAQGIENAEGEAERMERTERLERLLGEVIRIHNGRPRAARVEAVRVDGCRVDINDPRRRDRVACEEFLTVRVDAP
jgi:hypothetical protein